MAILGAGIGILLGAIVCVVLPSLFAPRWDPKVIKRILDNVHDNIYREP